MRPQKKSQAQYGISSHEAAVANWGRCRQSYPVNHPATQFLGQRWSKRLLKDNFQNLLNIIAAGGPTWAKLLVFPEKNLRPPTWWPAPVHGFPSSGAWYILVSGATRAINLADSVVPLRTHVWLRRSSPSVGLGNSEPFEDHVLKL